jgi:Domain of unknown function (DUF4349)
MHHTFSHRESPRPLSRAISLIALAALSGGLLAGCGAGGAASTSAVGTMNRAAAPAQPSSPGSARGPAGTAGAKNGAPGVPLAPGTSAGSTSGAPLAGVGPKLTKTASLDLQVKDITMAAAQVRTIAAGLQAQVLNEQIGTGSPGGPVPLQTTAGSLGGFGSLTLSVPAERLDTALDQLSRIGTVQQRTLSSQDVTAAYVDTQSRLKTMRASLDRVRALMAQAKDLGQVVALEGELSQRESDLESLESQLGALTNSVDRSTLTVSLSTPAHEPVTTTGFVAGLGSGWDAFTASLRGLLAGIGAVLPFALFMALVAAPIMWWLRRRRGLSTGGQPVS